MRPNYWFASLALALFAATAAVAANNLFAIRALGWFAELLALMAVIVTIVATAIAGFSLYTARKTLVRYRCAFEQHSAPMWILDTDTLNFLDVNEAALEEYGYTRSEFLAMTARDIRPAEDVPAFVTMLKRKIGSRHTETGLRHKRKDGRIFPVQVTATPLSFEGHRAELVLVQDMSLEVTATRAQQRLQEATELIDAVFNAAPLAIWGVDLEGKLTFWSRSAANMFGWEESEVTGCPVPVIPRDQAADYEQIAQQYRRGERLNGLERKRIRKDGSLLDCAIWSAPLRSPDGEIIGNVEILADISERKNSESELNRHVRRMAASNADLRQFAYAASHYLQEPIRAVITCTQMFEKLADISAPRAAFEYLRHAREGALRSRDLVKALGDYWEIDQHPLQIGPMPLADALFNARARLNGLITETGAEIVCGDLPVLMADLDLTTILLTHLLTNSIKFRSAAPPRIRLSAKSVGQSWTASVQDNGVGIEPEFAERVFGIFNRLSRASEGVGIGLSICRKIVELQHGRIWIVPESSGGTTIQFELPAVPK